MTGADQYAARGFAMPVAEQGSAVRTEFIRKTYKLFGAGLGITALVGIGTSHVLVRNPGTFGAVADSWLLVILGVWMLSAFLFGRMVTRPESAKTSLFIYAAIQGVIVGFLLALVELVTGSKDLSLQAFVLTGVVFGGLTGYVLITKEDFSFLKGFLTMAFVAFIGVVLFAVIFGLGFQMYVILCGAGVLLFGAFTLYDTSKILHKYPVGYEAVAAATLLADFVMLFWYILQLMLILSSRN